ncbi:Phox/Bem1p [Quillaja saponaria]|uniref:Phox/Bem1p n=1 Tax=Quillaja saponaria TaxID=32244 RepID=A0AAD7PXZ2_QUISA|nr:Phox/Bem1p [Quillaja saponaria]
MGTEVEPFGLCLTGDVCVEPGNGISGDMIHSLVSAGAESIVLETSSSFGSTSSSASSSNLPPIKTQVDEREANLQDGKVKFPYTDSTASDITVSSPMSYQETTKCYQDAVTHVSSLENRILSIQCNMRRQVITTASRESSEYDNEPDDDLSRVQIYKSQPPPPSLPSSYQTVTNSATNLLSETLAQLHMDNLNQQIGTAQPQ